ncbi:c6 zinc finger domain [Pyrenophora seminiperda CCB06]|uniref:C6 zinc finger domain n=1 Tax=Pyrenophora seminiperda CCB06 TaxID=1302712 RepID=A0A3M7M8F9_9PLEO|nr:c6 zinc finger domain [Pyrenophora seminiperda CCB06]
MVGVAGRSKGCVTCRKRKKGCDLITPECGQCKERGIKCGGYDSDRIFIYQSGGSNTSVLKESRQATTKISSEQPHRYGTQMICVRPACMLGIRNTRPNPVQIVLPDSLARSAYREQTMASFLRIYNPQGVIRATNADAREFVSMLPLLSSRNEALQMAALAVGITQLGVTSDDEALTRQGRTLYGKALRETAVALRNPIRVASESMLVVPRVMALFDLMFGADPDSTNQAKSWLSHVEGELAMIVNRGPEVFSKSDAAHAIFVHARYRLLWPAFRSRQSTILNQEEWKRLPWKGRAKSSDDSLVDILCGMPELLEAVDRIQFEPMAEADREGLQLYTLAKCWTLHFQLQEWVDTEANAIYIPNIIDTSTPITFPNIDIACVTVRYWLAALFLYSALDIASGIDATTDSLLSHPDRPHPRLFARMIIKSVEYFLQEQFGVTGVMAIAMPLGNALLYMNRNRQVDEEYIMTIMNVWFEPDMPSTLREFLQSFRQTVDIKTSLAIPTRQL